MAPKKPAPPVVADLGRPETPEEAAARKAAATRLHRANQTLRNLLWSLGATLIVVLLLVLVVVRPDPTTRDSIDYGAVAEQAERELGTSIAAPALPEGWTANVAELRTSGDIDAWYIGFITPEQQFIALNQGVDANPTWVDSLLEGTEPTGSITIGTVEWTVYDHRDAENPGNLAYALVTVDGQSTYVLNGTADDTEFETLATAMGVGNER